MKAAPPTAISELAQWPHWVCWKTTERDGKPTKVPVTPAGKPASSTDPNTWSSHADCVKALETKRFDGIGYVFTPDDEYFGVDLDHCTTGATVHPDAARIVQQLDSYTEFSPSGTGLHVIARGRVNGKRNRTKKTPWGHDFEVYDQARFFTVTGRQLFGSPATIESRQAELDAVCEQMFPVVEVNGRGKVEDFRGALLAPSTVDDVALEEKIRASKQGPKFTDLFDRGAPEGQESEADLALCNILAFWLGPDEPRIDAWFRRSALMRDKWDAPRGDTTYGGYTIARALEDRTEFYGQKKPTPLTKATVRDGDDRVAAEEHARARLGLLLGYEDLGQKITHGIASSRDTNATIELFDDAGGVLRLDPLKSYRQAIALKAEVAMQIGAMPAIGTTEVMEIFSLIRTVCTVRETFMFDERAFDYGVSFLRDVQELEVDMTDQDARWSAFQHLAKQDPVSDAKQDQTSVAHKSVVLHDRGAGLRYVPVQWFSTFVRTQAPPGVAEDVVRRMTGLGWEKPANKRGRIKATSPGGGDEQQMAFFIVRDGWENTS